jgi:ABC-type Fe3+-hydroxamate transport system substrate-binding protein
MPPTKEEIIAALSLEEIKQARPDLVKTLQSEMQESDEEKKERDEEKKKIETLEKENLDLKKKILDTHRAVLLAEIKDENVRALADGLLTGETTEKLDESWKLVQEKLGKIEKPGMLIISGADQGKKLGSEFVNEDLL